jgi:hypothetical protein
VKRLVGDRILRMLPVRDEADVLPYNLDWYAQAGFATVVVDDGSTDGSYELCEQALADGRLEALERLETERSDWRTILGTVFRLALRQEPDYLMLTAADEFFEVADGGDLMAAMREDFAAGYNVVRFSNMEFQMTDQDDPAEPNPVARMRYYTWRGRMARAYPCLPGLDIVGPGTKFPPGVERRRSPRQYVSRHYPFRTPEQALRKLRRMADRPPGEDRRDYLRFSGDPAELLTKTSRLFHYQDDHAWRYEDKAMGARLTHTEHALARVQEELGELRAEHAALKAEYMALRAGGDDLEGRTRRR